MDKITIVKYRAFDGIEFNDENECLNYERRKELEASQGVEKLKNNALDLMSANPSCFKVLTALKEYCHAFSAYGSCKDCIFGEDESCMFGDIVEAFDVDSIRNTVSKYRTLMEV